MTTPLSMCLGVCTLLVSKYSTVQAPCIFNLTPFILPIYSQFHPHTQTIDFIEFHVYLTQWHRLYLFVPHWAIWKHGEDREHEDKSIYPEAFFSTFYGTPHVNMPLNIDADKCLTISTCTHWHTDKWHKVITRVDEMIDSPLHQQSTCVASCDPSNLILRKHERAERKMYSTTHFNCQFISMCTYGCEDGNLVNHFIVCISCIIRCTHRRVHTIGKSVLKDEMYCIEKRRN